MDQALAATAVEVEALLDRLLPAEEGPPGRLMAAVRHAALAGGKRLRPFLLVSSAELFDVPRIRALRAGAAVEMVHCYSLVHDDLPAMDDSDLRRGRPSVHRAFDEATAILAGDGLLTEAFAVLADPATHSDAEVRCDLIAGLAAAAGCSGMVGGQMIDLSPQRDDLDLSGISELQALKTGALIAESCRAGGVLGGAGPAESAALLAFARGLGLAFQIVDDLLDVAGDSAELGKPAGRDAAQGKATFVRLLGVEDARARAGAEVAAALGHLDIFDRKADVLRQTAEFVLRRQR